MATARPRVELDDEGRPKFIDTISADNLRLIKPTGDDIDRVHKFRQVYGLEDHTQMRKFEEQYLQRFNLTPGNPRYAAALAQLANESNSQRVAVAQARRTAQRVETIEALEGNMQKNCIYVNDGPEPCDNCLALSGEEKPYSEFIANNEAPGDQCLGGDNCMCLLVPISGSTGKGAKPSGSVLKKLAKLEQRIQAKQKQPPPIPKESTTDKMRRQLDELREKRKAAEKKLREQEERNRKLQEEAKKAQAEATRRKREAEEKERKIKELEAKLKKEQAKVKAIDKKLAREDRRRDRAR